MDFVSEHYGAIAGNAMRTPGQFTHPLIVRAKLEIAAACHAHGKIPSHNVTTEISDTSVVASDAHRATTERSEEHTSELQSLMRISYAVFCLKKKKKNKTTK